MKLVIKGSQWLRATGNIGYENSTGTYTAQLWRGKRGCCLGILANQCGMSQAKLSRDSKFEPTDYAYTDVPQQYRDFCWDGGESANWLQEAMEINDESEYTDAQKIKKLRPAFAEAGITLIWKPNE